MKRSKKPLERPDWLALAALGISVLALLVSVFDGYATRRNYRLSLIPDMWVSFAFNDEGAGWSWGNRGLGPAEILGVQVSVDGTRYVDWGNLTNALNLPVKRFQFAIPRVGDLVPSGHDNRLFWLSAGAGAEVLKAVRDQVNIEVCFCSLYKECWITSYKGSGKGAVESCEGLRWLHFNTTEMIQLDWKREEDALLTYQTIKGLEWLDLTETAGSSHEEVMSRLLDGGKYEGFRYANVEDLVAFLKEAGLPTDAAGELDASEHYRRLEALLTSGTSMANPTAGVRGALLGMVSVQERQGASQDFATAGIARDVDSGMVRFYLSNEPRPDLGGARVGHWLVREHGAEHWPGRRARRDLEHEFMEKGIEAGVSLIRELSAKSANAINEDVVNDVGYSLLSTNRIQEAMRMFELNVEAHPDSSNAYDSLAESCEKAGEYERAIANYKKSLELDERNQHASARLRELMAAVGRES